MLLFKAILLVILLMCSIAWTIDKVDAYMRPSEQMGATAKVVTALVVTFGWPLFYYLTHLN